MQKIEQKSVECRSCGQPHKLNDDMLCFQCERVPRERDVKRIDERQNQAQKLLIWLFVLGGCAAVIEFAGWTVFFIGQAAFWFAIAMYWWNQAEDARHAATAAIYEASRRERARDEWPSEIEAK